MIRIKSTSKVLDNSKKVSVGIDITTMPTYGYGYGYHNVGGELDFFDIFGLDGEKVGYFVDPETPNGYSYGFGYEYTENIIGYEYAGDLITSQRVRTCTVTVTKLDGSPIGSTIYTVNVHVKGQGYCSPITGTTDSQGKFSFIVNDFNPHVDDVNYFTHDEMIIIDDSKQEFGEVLQNTSKSVSDSSEKDSYLDILVEVEDTFSKNPRIRLFSNIYDSSEAENFKILVNARISE